MNCQRFLDPLYGHIEFGSQESRLIFSPEIQRLRFVRMCNINSLLLTGASEPRRFEHVIGVLHLAHEWTATHAISANDARVVHAAALLHDFQTPPFGHSLEYILRDNSVRGGFQHEEVGLGSDRQYLQQISANAAFAGARFGAKEALGELWPHVAETIAGRGRFGPLVSGTVDLDNIDNVVRLAYHMGIAERVDAELALELARDVELHGRSLSVSEHGAELLERWRAIRSRLYELLLHDWAEFSAKAMLTTMLEFAVQADMLGADDWVLTDDELLDKLVKEAVGDAQYIGELGRRLRLGDLYSPLVLWRSPNVDSYDVVSRAAFKREFERRLSEQAGAKCILHFILDKAKTERRLSLWVRGRNELQSFGVDSREVLIGIFLSRSETSPKVAAAVCEWARRMLAEHFPNLDPLPDPLPPPEPEDSRQLSLLR